MNRRKRPIGENSKLRTLVFGRTVKDVRLQWYPKALHKAAHAYYVIKEKERGVIVV